MWRQNTSGLIVTCRPRVMLVWACLLLWLALPSILSAQAGNGISAPAPDAVIAGVVLVEGTAQDASFLRYELAFRPVGRADWIVFAEGSQPVLAGTLAVWDTTVGRQAGAPVFPDGSYQLRLRVVRTDYNYDEHFVRDVVVANDSATPTPETTPLALATAGAPSPTLPPDAATLGGPARVLPSLTPFPTPTRESPSNVAAISAQRPAGRGEPSGVLAQLTSIDFGRFGRAFWYGVRLTGVFFAALALYMGLRWLLRLGWRRLQARGRRAALGGRRHD